MNQNNLLGNYVLFIFVIIFMFIVNMPFKLKYIIGGILLFIIVMNIILNENINKELFHNIYSSLHNRISYDNLILKKEPSYVSLIKPNNKYINDYSKDYPTVDGTENTPKSLFTFAYNKCSLDCCPSTFSCDKGCICTTEQQRKFINNRGII